MTSIIIPVYGEERYIRECLNALADHTADQPYDVVLVDNGMGYHFDATPNLRCIVRNSQNLGFSVACNQGAAVTRSESVCFLNMDTQAEAGWLGPLVAALDDPEVVIAGPRVVSMQNGALEGTGIRTWHGGGDAGGEVIHDDPEESCDRDGIGAVCMVIRRQAFLDMGGFCELYWNGAEDVDLCLTARERGHRLRYVRESQIQHHGSFSGHERSVKSGENGALLIKRWAHR